MAPVFADTGYWIAVLLPDDHLHGRATAMAAAYGASAVVTTQMVLVEVLTTEVWCTGWRGNELPTRVSRDRQQSSGGVLAR